MLRRMLRCAFPATATGAAAGRRPSWRSATWTSPGRPPLRSSTRAPASTRLRRQTCSAGHGESFSAPSQALFAWSSVALLKQQQQSLRGACAYWRAGTRGVGRAPLALLQVVLGIWMTAPVAPFALEGLSGLEAAVHPCTMAAAGPPRRRQWRPGRSKHQCVCTAVPLARARRPTAQTSPPPPCCR